MYQILMHLMKSILNRGPVIQHFEHAVTKMSCVCALFRVLQVTAHKPALKVNMLKIERNELNNA